MLQAAEEVAATTTVENPGHLQFPATSISFDRTWHKWGHSSHDGVDVATDGKTRFVLNTQVPSNNCHGFERGSKPNDENSSMAR